MPRGYLTKIAKAQYGFVRDDAGGTDYFVPARLIASSGVGVGDYVEFDSAFDAGNGKSFVTRINLYEGEGPRLKHRGTVTSSALDRGFTFVRPDDGSGDAFLHITTMQRAGLELQRGDRVSYEVAESPQPGRRPNVIKIELAS
jgi:CspA family cold shock protein